MVSKSCFGPWGPPILNEALGKSINEVIEVRIASVTHTTGKKVL